MKQKLALWLTFGVALSLTALPASAQQTQPTAPQQAVAQASIKTCLTCHGSDPKVTAILHSKMAVIGDPRTPFAQGGCVVCHGDSKKHVAMQQPYPDIVFSGPHASPVAERNKVCLTCHENGQRMNWEGSAHQNNNVACTNCHTAHAAQDPVLTRLTQPAKCFTCHARQRAESYEYSHHPMREGKVVCSDCHNPHGTAGDTKLLKEFTTNQTCYTCHADKRGPMLWEHQPVREDCLNCHSPHGSNQPRLLKEPLNFLCSSCHSSQANSSGGAFGGAHSIPFGPTGSQFFSSALANQRACLNCHSQVHGSNNPNGAYFLR